jgi:phospholipid/cholesterol/gamma-HCH transport system ATP-binding protein
LRLFFFSRFSHANVKINPDDIMIKLRGQEEFGNQAVLSDVNLDIRRVKHAIIGQSGVGKSVILKHMIGLLQPDEGKLLWMGWLSAPRNSLIPGRFGKKWACFFK